MKEIAGWLRWTWANWQTWQRWFVFAMFLNFSSMAVPAPYNFYVGGTGILIVFGFMVKWFILDSIKASWNKYKQHRNELFTTIKESDR